MNSDADDRNLEALSDSTDNLEDALKWLENLTIREGKPAEQASTSDASLDSPFHGLIDSEEGDMPDWLREVPSALSSTQGEMESRLDWLAKMAQRESIEELDTLEWRRLPEPVQNAILSTREGALADEADSPAADESGERAAQEQDEFISSPEPGRSEMLFLETGQPEASIPDTFAQEATSETELLETERLLAEMTNISPGAIRDEAYPAEDLDAAMAWIEELAASQDAPTEDYPSVGDRALVSKLMTEAGLAANISPLDELGSDPALMEGFVPPNPFIEEEDQADTIVLGESTTPEPAVLPSTPVEVSDEEVATPETILSEPAVREEPSIDDETAVDSEELEVEIIAAVSEPRDAVEAAPQPETFEEAMAYLDEMAVVPPAEPTEVGGEVVDELPASAEVTEPASSGEGVIDVTAESRLETVLETEPVAAAEPTNIDEGDIDATAADEQLETIIEMEPAAVPAEVEELLAEAAPWLDSDAALDIEAAVEAGSMSASVEDEFVPAADQEVVIEGEMIVATDELLEPLADEVLQVEEAPWFEDSNIFPIDNTVPEVSEVDVGKEEPADAALLTTLVAVPEEAHDGEQLDQVVEAAESEAEPATDALDALSGGPDERQLEAALLALDSLALPAGRTLADFEATEAEAQSAPARDVTAALVWLESVLTGGRPPRPQHSALSDLGAEELFAQMPDDPDAVLAWLEEMAGEESTAPAPPLAPVAERHEASAPAAAPPIDELYEADLLAMPEDPDEAMAWLEGLARGGEPPVTSTPVAALAIEIPNEPAGDLFSDPTVKMPWDEDELQETHAHEEGAAAPEPPSPPAPAGGDGGDAWVDLLKPLN
jgi:hypothetical protein